VVDITAAVAADDFGIGEGKLGDVTLDLSLVIKSLNCLI